MRRIFTHLNSRLANDSVHPWRKAFFLEDPDCPTLVVNSSNDVNAFKDALLGLEGAHATVES